MKTILHRLRHLFGLNTGHVYTWWDSDSGRLMIGFRCDGCDTIEHVSARPSIEKIHPHRKERTDALGRMADNARELGLDYTHGVLPSGDHACALNLLADGSCSVCRQRFGNQAQVAAAPVPPASGGAR